jgi:hypothetical protein
LRFGGLSVAGLGYAAAVVQRGFRHSAAQPVARLIGYDARMAAPSFDDFVAFVRDYIRPPRTTAITRSTRFEADLDITGDDGCDLLEKTEKRFQVRLSSEEHGYRQTFNLGPNEYLFHSEGCNPFAPLMALFRRSPPPTIMDLTVGDLYDAVCRLSGE